ncbi:MAG: hypothetical protein RL141_728 [Candidatus Parcubacteria bacterium]|jgi:hypothetical protein
MSKSFFCFWMSLGMLLGATRVDAQEVAPPEIKVTCEAEASLFAKIAKTEADRDAFKLRAEQCEKREADAKKAPKTGAGGGNSGGDKKAAAPPKLDPFSLGCPPPATKETRADGLMYCVTPEGVVVHSVDEDAPYLGRKAKGVVVPSFEEFDRFRDAANAKLDAVCGGSETQDCVDTRTLIKVLGEWHKELTAPPEGEKTPGLNWETWKFVFNRTNGGLEALVNVYCPVIPDKPEASLQERCAAKAATFCSRENPDACPESSRSEIVSPATVPALYFNAEGILRPGPGPESLHLRADTLLNFYGGPDRVGFYLHFGGGFSLNADKYRYAVAAGTGLVVDISDDKDRGAAFRGGLEYRAEPTLGPNDSHMMGGGLAIDWTLDDLPAWFWTVGVLAGANTYQNYNEGVRSESRSDFVFFGAMNLGTGVQF